ncbi:MAG TPA: TIGR01777 family oxidoreductase [Acidimicrobiales bacterium]|nr:TIGR01777 family oxidoreductase [Acidimicrobiales bacterium]
MKVVVTGSHGLIGSAVVARLRADDHDVVRLVRSRPGPGEARWDPASGVVDPAAVDGATAVVHLAGAGIGDHRWSPAYKAEILDSRVTGTRAVARAVATAAEPRPALISASAVGWYGSARGDETLTEDSSAGSGFLAEVCRRWEEATTPAADAGARVVHMRNGVVLSAAGGALGRQLPLFRLGLGGRLGSGSQHLTWISRRDVAGAIIHLIAGDISGPVNLCAPNPVTNAEFTAALGRVLRRPARLAVPRPALRLALGSELVEQVILADQRAVPARLSSSGFGFAHPDIESALPAALADDRLEAAP